MKSTKLSRFSASNVATAIFLLTLVGLMTWLITGDVRRMQAATTNFDFYQNAIYLIDNIARTYFFGILMLMVYLTYINKQYSKWCVRLFYVTGISTLAYYAFASNYYGYVFDHVESEYIDKTVSLVRSLFTGPLYWIIIGFFFVPKILKDAQKLKGGTGTNSIIIITNERYEKETEFLLCVDVTTDDFRSGDDFYNRSRCFSGRLECGSEC